MPLPFSSRDRSRRFRSPSKRSSYFTPLLAALLIGIAWLTGIAKSWEIGNGPRYKVLTERKSEYNGDVRVVEDEYGRYLMFGNSLQTGQDRKNPNRSALRYVDGFHLGRIVAPHAKTALFIGLGGGMGPRQFHEFYPAMKIEAVEIDPAVAEIARTYFKLPQDSRMKTHVGDGRAFLEKSESKFDLIFLDAYDAHSAPPLLTTVEFMKLIRRHLAPKGALVANVIAARTGPRSGFGRSEYKTIRSVFPYMAVFPIQSALDPTESDATYENLMMIATSAALPPSPEAWSKRAKPLLRPEIADLAKLVAHGPLANWPTDDVSVLTDKNPPHEDLFGE